MPQLFKNNATSFLFAGISASDLTLRVLSGEGSKYPVISVEGDYFDLTLTQAGAETSWEIVRVTATAGDIYTIVRAQEGTTAAIWAGASKVDLRLTALYTVGAQATVALDATVVKSISADTLITNERGEEYLRSGYGMDHYGYPLAEFWLDMSVMNWSTKVTVSSSLPTGHAASWWAKPVWFSNKWVMATYSGTTTYMSYSTDLKNWTSVSVRTTAPVLTHLTQVGSTLILTAMETNSASNAEYYTCTDGMSWYLQTGPCAMFGKVFTMDGVTGYVYQGGKKWSTTNGTSWTDCGAHDNVCIAGYGLTDTKWVVLGGSTSHYTALPSGSGALTLLCNTSWYVAGSTATAYRYYCFTIGTRFFVLAIAAGMNSGSCCFYSDGGAWVTVTLPFNLYEYSSGYLTFVKDVATGVVIINYYGTSAIYKLWYTLDGINWYNNTLNFTSMSIGPSMSYIDTLGVYYFFNSTSSTLQTVFLGGYVGVPNLVYVDPPFNTQVLYKRVK